MAADMIDKRAVEGILYGVYRALHNVVGDGASAVMRKAAPDILDELGKLGVDFSCVDDVEKLEAKLGETMSTVGLCDKMQFSLNGNELTANIIQCSLFELTDRLKSEGIPPFGCPFAALTIAVAEKNLGKKARLKSLEPGANKGDTVMVVELHDK